MHRKFDTASAALAFAFVLLAGSSAFAQVIERRVGPAVRVPVELRPAAPASLGCCTCLGGKTALDLSTVKSNPWTVGGGAANFLPAPNPAWNLNPGPAQWVSNAADGVTGVAAGAYEYRLAFVVPACTIGQEATLAGNYGGDNTVSIFLDDASGQDDATNSNFVAKCPRSGYCFSSVHNPSLPSFSRNVSPGNHVLIVKVQNDGGPSGMFVNAALTGACRRE
ncbi:MAG TPA: hypothetical protein VM936_15970 [Pyrinomonadaceae bacterium]|nr:hypothetical protein [Pyrinomonadaceae bacterium]